MFYKIPVQHFLAALEQSRIGWLLLVIFVSGIVTLLVDSWATARVLSWFLTPVTFRELVPVRAVTYLPGMINANLGQAGIVYWIHRVKGASALAATGVQLMIMGTMLLVLCFITLGALPLAQDSMVRRVGQVSAVLLAGACVYFVILAVRPAWLYRRRLLQPLFDAGVWGHLKATALRIPHVAALIIAHWLAMLCFDITPPAATVLILIPAILLVSSLPLTPMGIGTIQVAEVYFFSPFASGATPAEQEAAALAYSIALPVLMLGLHLVFGLISLRFIGSDLKRPADRQSGP